MKISEVAFLKYKHTLNKEQKVQTNKYITFDIRGSHGKAFAYNARDLGSIPG